MTTLSPMREHYDWEFLDFHVSQNADFRDEVTLGRNGDTWTLTGATVAMRWRNRIEEQPVGLFSTTNGKIEIVDAAARRIRFAVPYTDIAAIEPIPDNILDYDLLVTHADGSVRRRLVGAITVDRAITPTALSTLTDMIGYAPSRINILPWQRDAMFNDWASSQFTLTNASKFVGAIAPDASNTALRLTETTALGEHRLFWQPQIGRFKDPVVYRLAIAARPAGRTRLLVRVNQFNDDTAVTFDNAVAAGLDLSGNAVFESTVGANFAISAAFNKVLPEGYKLFFIDFNYLSVLAGANIWQMAVNLDAGSGLAARNISYTGIGGKAVDIAFISLLPKVAWDITKLELDEDFDNLSTIDLADSKAAGFKWYTHNLFPTSSMPTFGWHTNPPSAPTPAANLSISAPSVLRIYNPNFSQSGYQSQIWSVVDAGPGAYLGKVFKGPCVFDGLFSWDGRQSTFKPGWAGNPAFWGVSVDALTNNPRLKAASHKHFVEWDVVEAAPSQSDTQGGSSTVHDWDNVVNNLASGVNALRSMQPGDFHRWTGLWIPALASNYTLGRYLSFYDGTCFNDLAYAASIGDGRFSLSDGHEVSCFLNTAENSSADPSYGGWEMLIDWVRIYAHPAPPTFYALLDPFDKNASLTLDPAGYGYTVSKPTSGDGSWHSVRASVGHTSGQWYWEFKLTGASIGAAAGVTIGIGSANASLTAFPGASAQGAGIQHGVNMNTTVNGVTGVFTGSTTFAANDVFGFALDLNAGKCYVHKNGTWINGAPGGAGVWSGITGQTWFPMIGMNAAGNGNVVEFNGGHKAFAFSAPYSGLTY